MAASTEMRTLRQDTPPENNAQSATADSEEKTQTYVGIWLGMDATDLVTHCVVISAFEYDRAASDVAGIAGLKCLEGGAAPAKYRLAHLIRGRDIHPMAVPNGVRPMPTPGSAEADMVEKYLAAMHVTPDNAVIKPREPAPPGGAALN
jgi:hypothetical protein